MNQRDSENGVRYTKSNACTKKPSFAMLFTLFVMITVIVLHALIIRPVVDIAHPVLSVLLAFNYVTLAAVSIDYFILLLIDPVDPRLLTDNFVETEMNKKMLVYCTACRKNVHVYSYHCKVCMRCADEFDHHCIFLNNCIGRKNYANFFRVLLTLSIFLAINIGEAVWVALEFDDARRWLAVSLAVCAGLVLPEVIGLMFFHCYISLCLYKTTLEYIRGELDQDRLKDYMLGGIKAEKKAEIKADTETSINRHEHL